MKNIEKIMMVVSLVCFIITIGLIIVYIDPTIVIGRFDASEGLFGMADYLGGIAAIRNKIVGIMYTAAAALSLTVGLGIYMSIEYKDYLRFKRVSVL